MTFGVLPTDDRFRELTYEQLELLNAHYWRMMEPKDKPTGLQDPDYDNEEVDSEVSEGEEIKDKEHRLPLADHESFDDPEFDAEWNEVDEEEDSDLIGEESSESVSQTRGEEEISSIEEPIDDDNEGWEVL